jgi:LacI family transcriptional regulator
VPTIHDVARRAGVSAVTVSRVINNVRNVSPVTRQKVQRAIQDLGYVPSVAARSLRSKRTRTLALVVPDVTNVFWTTVARGVEDAAQSCGYSVFLFNTDETPARQLRALEVIASQRVDGAIIAPHDSDARNLVTLRARGIPTVVIDRRIEGWEVDTVRGDSISGAYALVRHLIQLGHRRIAMVSGPAKASSAEDRVAGYCMALSHAGIPVSPALIRRGEFQAASGERLTYQLLDEGLDPSAVFAANNAIAMGVIDALDRRGLCVPEDVALVCFDDLPNAPRIFPFLTVAVQPAYDMGVNAAQLLLSRLEAGGGLPPREVVLPVRLIVRHSCGSRPGNGRSFVPRLPRRDEIQADSRLVKPLSPEDMQGWALSPPGLAPPAARDTPHPVDRAKSDARRLVLALQGRQPDRVPHLEFRVRSRPIYEYVLGRRLDYLAPGEGIDDRPVEPEDAVEFARRLGMDAVTCAFDWRIEAGRARSMAGAVETGNGPDELAPPPLTAQLNRLERYLRAAAGTGVGVAASFASFFDIALRALGRPVALESFHAEWAALERLMDKALAHQEKILRVVCDRFAGGLALVLIEDDLAGIHALPGGLESWVDMFAGRMQRLIAPAREHGLPVVLHGAGAAGPALPVLHRLGFAAVYPSALEACAVFELRRAWAGRLALVGHVPPALLRDAGEESVEQQVREYLAGLGEGGGYVLASAGCTLDGVPPENFVAMARAVHTYGRRPGPARAA